MKVKIFDFEHEEDLEFAINNFLNSNIELIDLKYQISHFSFNGEQIYSFSCLILYNSIKN
ncbi:MAG: sporulation protein Cse60 [Anaeroplasma sp.]